MKMEESVPSKMNKYSTKIEIVSGRSDIDYGDD